MKKLASVILTFVVLATLFAPPVMWADNGPDHQAWQTRPIQLGTTGENINDRSAASCCSGTLGALVQNATTQFILSNNHVLARTNRAASGEDIIQPGLSDQNPVCDQDLGDAVADLSAFKPISFTKGTTNTIDTAIAEVRANAVDPSGSILDMGQVNTSIVAAALGMGVRKSGRKRRG